MIKIFHFIPTLNCDSGITSLIMSYFRKIDKSKFNFYFIYFLESDKKNYESEIIELGGKCLKVSSPKNFINFKKDLRIIFNKYCDSEEIIFHNHLINFTVLINDLLKKYFGKKVIIHNHQTKYSDRKLSSIRNRILCIPLKFYDYNFFACSDDAGKKIFGKNKDYFILNNSIDVDRYKFNSFERQNLRNQFNFASDDIVFGHVGRFEYAKNHLFLIELFHKISLLNNNCKLLLVGNGRLKNNICDKINEMNLNDKVVILDARDDIPSILSSMDFFLFPSIFEGLGMVAVEAQASGLPIIISDTVPSITGINNFCFLSLNDSFDVWTSKVFEMLNDYSLVSRESSNILLYNSIFDINENVKILENKYKDILYK